MNNDRLLPILLAQVNARKLKNAPDELYNEVYDLCVEFPNTKLIVYPEYHAFHVSGLPNERKKQYQEMAVSLEDQVIDKFKKIAKDMSIWFLPGTIIEKGNKGEIYNTMPVFSPDGQLVESYRKIFPWRPFEPFTSGSEFKIFEIPNIGKVGLAICYDLWFPEIARQLTYMGAEVIIYPMQTSTIDREQELILAKATSIQNQVFTISINAAEPVGTGRSIIVDPEGIVRHMAPSETAAFITDVLDFNNVSRVQSYGTCGLNRIWHQMNESDATINLPLYDGKITANKWNKG